MTYIAEPVPSLIVLDMLNSEWTLDIPQVPKPQIIHKGENLRSDLKNKSQLEIGLSSAGEQEEYIDTWQYVSRTATVEIKIYSGISRQNLYDLKREIRRIIHKNKHLVDGYQVIRYLRFMENTEGKVRNWEGTVLVSLETSGQRMEV